MHNLGCAAKRKVTDSAMSAEEESPKHRGFIKHVHNLPSIRRAEFENHNKDGGMWLIINKRIYDVKEFR